MGVGAVLIFGGGFLALEFLHWLAHGGFSKFLIGSALAIVFFFFLVLWANFLAKGSQILRSKPAAFALIGLLVAGGVISHYFLAG